MKLLNKIFFFSILFSYPLYSQNDSTRQLKTDSERSFNNSIGNILFQFDEFDFYRELIKLKRDLEINEASSKLWLETSVGILNKSTFEDEKDRKPGYLHSSLYEQYLEDSKFNPIRTALGMIQAGAVGYLAYQHIKKWVIKK